MHYYTPPFKIPIGIYGGNLYIPVKEALFFLWFRCIFVEIENNRKRVKTCTEMHNYIFHVI